RTVPRADWALIRLFCQLERLQKTVHVCSADLSLFPNNHNLVKTIVYNVKPCSHIRINCVFQSCVNGQLTAGEAVNRDLFLFNYLPLKTSDIAIASTVQ